ncbi:MAG: hypothetical protein N2606_04085 [Candidatus Omnitrophica bacterium]|nr:hypothetical protein [Candidatus Omnitrophota bacterium]
MGLILFPDSFYRETAKNLFFFSDKYSIKYIIGSSLNEIYDFVEELRNLNHSVLDKEPHGKLDRYLPTNEVSIYTLIYNLLAIEYQLQEIPNNLTVKKLKGVINSLLIEFFYEKYEEQKERSKK